MIISAVVTRPRTTTQMQDSTAWLAPQPAAMDVIMPSRLPIVKRKRSDATVVLCRRSSSPRRRLCSLYSTRWMKPARSVTRGGLRLQTGRAGVSRGEVRRQAVDRCVPGPATDPSPPLRKHDPGEDQELAPRRRWSPHRWATGHAGICDLPPMTTTMEWGPPGEACSSCAPSSTRPSGLPRDGSRQDHQQIPACKVHEIARLR